MTVFDDLQQITMVLLKLPTVTNAQNEKIVEVGQRLTDFETAMKEVREAFERDPRIIEKMRF